VEVADQRRGGIGRRVRRKKIFDAQFFRARRESALHRLGLCLIARGIVEAHGGFITRWANRPCVRRDRFELALPRIGQPHARWTGLGLMRSESENMGANHSNDSHMSKTPPIKKFAASSSRKYQSYKVLLSHSLRRWISAVVQLRCRI